MNEINYQHRRQSVLLLLSGIFLGCMSMLNIVGISKFIQMGPFQVAVGVLPYPLTFLCTDIIGEFYGKKVSNQVVWIGLLVNALIVFFMWLGHTIPPVSPELRPPWQDLYLSQPVTLATGTQVQESTLFELMYTTSMGAVFASMMAYLAAQFCDVKLFHYFKNLTKGDRLWVRNNFSTLGSQLVDTVTVVSITFGAALMNGQMSVSNFIKLLLSSYILKAICALLDTPLFYLAHRFLKNYLKLDSKTIH